MNSELVIASIKPYLKEWKARGNDTRFLNTKIRKGRAKGSDDIATELAYLLAEASMNSGSSGGVDEDKYNNLLKEKSELQSLNNQLKSRISDIQDTIKEREYKCMTDVGNIKSDNKILKQKNDNIKKWWVNDLGGDIDDLLTAMNKGLIMNLELEVDNSYCPYSDEDATAY